MGSLLGRALGDTSYGQLAIFNEVVRLVLDAYVEPVNLDRAMAGARLGMTDALDGDSSYLDAEEYKLVQQPLAETDADVGLVLTRRFAFLMVVAARPGSPAAKAGLAAGRHPEGDRRAAHAAAAGARRPSGCCAARPARR